nr:hypothetical protein [uncultured Acidocella sp.]
MSRMHNRSSAFTLPNLLVSERDLDAALVGVTFPIPRVTAQATAIIPDTEPLKVETDGFMAEYIMYYGPGADWPGVKLTEPTL